MQDYSLARPALPSEASNPEQRTEAEVKFGEASYAYFLVLDSGSPRSELERAAKAMDHWSAKLRAL